MLYSFSNNTIHSLNRQNEKFLAEFFMYFFSSLIKVDFKKMRFQHNTFGFIVGFKQK